MHSSALSQARCNKLHKWKWHFCQNPNNLHDKKHESKLGWYVMWMCRLLIYYATTQHYENISGICFFYTTFAQIFVLLCVAKKSGKNIQQARTLYSNCMIEEKCIRRNYTLLYAMHIFICSTLQYGIWINYSTLLYAMYTNWAATVQMHYNNRVK